MPSFDLTTRSGETRTLTAPEGVSLMEAIRRGGVYELDATCGGSCSCATCHVYVDDAFLPLLPPMGEMEDGLLDTSPHRTSASRLSCQVPLSAPLDGITVRIAPPD